MDFAVHITTIQREQIPTILFIYRLESRLMIDGVFSTERLGAWLSPIYITQTRQL